MFLFVRQIYARARKRYGIAWTVKGVLKALLHGSIRNAAKVDVLFICHDAHRHGLLDSKAFSPLIDGIICALPSHISTLTMAAPFSEMDGKSTYASCVNLNRPILFGYLRRLLTSHSVVLRSIESDYVVDAYRQILLATRPTVVIGIQPSVEFCIAAKRQAITVFDVQHGIISDVNYYSLEKRKSITQAGWPEAILCWDKSSASRVDQITAKNTQSIIIGNPCYHSPLARRRHAAPDEEHSVSSVKNVRRILVTLTYLDWDEDSSISAGITDAAFKQVGMTQPVIDLIKASTSIDWCVRMHPIQYRLSRDQVSRRLSKLFRNHQNVEWEKTSSSELASVLTHCDGHLTVNSAVAIDALQNGIKTVLVGCPGWSDEGKIKDYFGLYLSDNLMRYEGYGGLNLGDLLSFWNSRSSVTEAEKIENYDVRFKDFIGLVEAMV